MSDLVVAIGLVLVIEGVLWGFFPAVARDLVEAVRRVPDAVMRMSGLGAVVLGFVLIWLIRG